MVKLGVDSSEHDFLMDVAAEEINLFGNDNVVLYVPHFENNQSIHDPLYGESSSTSYKYSEYMIKGKYHSFSTTEDVMEDGERIEWTQTLDVARRHLLLAGVPVDTYSGDQAFVGCVVGIKILGKYEFFDIMNTENDGVSGSDGFFTSVILDLKQNTRFDPSRKIGDNE